MEFRSQGRRGEKSREGKKRQPSSQGHREGYSALHFQMTSQIERMRPRPHIFNCQAWGFNKTPFCSPLSGREHPADPLPLFK